MTIRLDVLCAGAAQALLEALGPAFASAHDASLEPVFNAVGALREALLAGRPCDLLIVTDAMAQQLHEAGRLGSAGVPLGGVPTSIAVRAEAAPPDVATAAALEQALRAAPAIFFPDPERSTAGIHFAAVLERLGIAAQRHIYANGAAAMRALAASDEPGALGCTQASEILRTPGLRLVGPLPAPFDLVTVYAAAVPTRAAEPELAARLIDWLAGPSHSPQRRQSGFEPIA